MVPAMLSRNITLVGIVRGRHFTVSKLALGQSTDGTIQINDHRVLLGTDGFRGVVASIKDLAGD